MGARSRKRQMWLECGGKEDCGRRLCTAVQMPKPLSEPPSLTWAATVCDLVGKSFVMQAVLNPASERPNAARRPAPPAPTTTASNSWSTTGYCVEIWKGTIHLSTRDGEYSAKGSGKTEGATKEQLQRGGASTLWAPHGVWWGADRANTESCRTESTHPST